MLHMPVMASGNSNSMATQAVIDLSSDDENEKHEPSERLVANAKDSRKTSEGPQFDQQILVKTEEGHVDRTQTAAEAQLPSQDGSIHGKQGKNVCRHFWSAGDYDAISVQKSVPQGGMDHIRVHPKFLHSNATSHKWALGAIAELLDNAVDEVPNGATFVKVDKIINPRDGTPALLFQDDGGGMDPENIRQCMSLGYSRKASNATIGQYGNGFKTSTMRLGADVIVYSRRKHGSSVTQSVGLLSYTFLRENGHEDIVVPIVDFEYPKNSSKAKMLVRTTADDWVKTLSTILQWGPFTSESDLLKQFDDIGTCGTKIIVYNLWLNDDGVLELDFDTDENDIQLRTGLKEDKKDKLHYQLAQTHIANQLRYSLRVYASILYLRMPPNFQIILRGKVVEHHSIAADLKFPEYIIYKPQVGGPSATKEVSVLTTIGFTKEAPMVNVHGFNVYHKNRLIMPFWKVLHENSSRGRGVVGVLEANFIEPAHDKQDFEKTALLLRLETRLKHMTVEYWNLHCGLIGYQAQSQKNRKVVQPIASEVVGVALPAAVHPMPVFHGISNTAFQQPLNVTPTMWATTPDPIPSSLATESHAHMDDVKPVISNSRPLSEDLPGIPENVPVRQQTNEAISAPQSRSGGSGGTISSTDKLTTVKLEETSMEYTKRRKLAENEIGPQLKRQRSGANEEQLQWPGANEEQLQKVVIQEDINHLGVKCCHCQNADVSLQKALEENKQLCLRYSELEQKTKELETKVDNFELLKKELELKVDRLQNELLLTKNKYIKLMKDVTDKSNGIKN